MCLEFIYLIDNCYYLAQSLASGCAWLPHKLLSKSTVNHSNSCLGVTASYYNYSIVFSKYKEGKAEQKRLAEAKGEMSGRDVGSSFQNPPWQLSLQAWTHSIRVRSMENQSCRGKSLIPTDLI